MKNPYEVFKSLFDKTLKLEDIENADVGFCILINKWMSYNPHTLTIAKNVIHNLFYLAPQNYLLLLYFAIPKQSCPRIHKAIEKEDFDTDLLNKLVYVLSWSSKELIKNMPIIKSFILPNEDEWKKELGVECKKTKTKKT